jgi:hypothetical protein
VRIAADYPRLAEVLDRFALVRSLVSKEGDHERGQYTVKTGYRPDPTAVHPALGAIAAHELPAPGLELPRFIALGGAEFPSRGGYLGNEFDPYRVFAPGQKGQNLVPHVPVDRQSRRLGALDALTRSFETGRGEAVRRTFHEHTLREALTLMTSEQLAAFDLDGESESVKGLYGDSDFGRGCLVARRLAERGVRFVELIDVGSSNNWDSHGNMADHEKLARAIDQPIAGLITDLKRRGMLERTLVVWTSEFGRTPFHQTADHPGREHHNLVFSSWMAGGGIRGGIVHGKSDEHGILPVEGAVHTHDLHATMLAALGLDHERLTFRHAGRDYRLTDVAGRVVRDVLA